MRDADGVDFNGFYENNGDENMTEKACCPTCGAKMVEYRHRLNAGLCAALLQLASSGGQGMLAEIGLTKSQYCNFQKLKYWHLVEKVEKKDDEGRGGEWKMTTDGENFVMGLIAMPEWTITYRGEMVRSEGKYKFMKEIFNKYDHKPFYRDTAAPVGNPDQKAMSL